MQQITYHLCGEQSTSDEFYQELAAFSQQVYQELESKAHDVLTEYAEFLRKNIQETPRSSEEYAIEFLTLAMTWRRYLGAAQATRRPAMKLLKSLYSVRSRHPALKPVLDPMRGLLAGMLLVPKIGRRPLREELNSASFNRLLLWLEASGEFKDEVKRFRNWRHYLESKSAVECAHILNKALTVFAWFACRAKETLGKYTTDVSRFLNTEYKTYRWREDAVFCGKEEVEYHINMVASEIINQGFRREFLSTPRRAALIPGCLRSDQGDRCRAKRNSLDVICTGCTETCRVNLVRKAMNDKGYDVYIVPHSSSFTRWLKKWENSREFGVVAVACPLNIVVGGYEMRELSIPSQCVLLDYCGCRKHWHKEGIATDLNINRLLHITGNGV